MNEIPLLVDIAVALAAAFVGGLIARRFGLPTILGYLLAGVAIGPFTPGFVGNVDSIGQLAELGVIFLMFGVGLHFSLADLWAVRDIALPGAIAQMAISTAIGFALTRIWGWTVGAGLVLGLAISIASTVVLLRSLMDLGWLNTRHGRVAVGWLIVQDIATVLILVLLPALGASEGENVLVTTGIALLKAAAFVALMLVVGMRLVPWLLLRIVNTRSHELFILAIVAVSVGTALSSAALFGVSLALGAFLAGVVVSESSVSHQVAADVLPFREMFTVLFFVSIGMLVNPLSLIENAVQVAALTLLIVLGNSTIGSLIAFIFPHPARTALVIGAGLSQIGEFSFILGRAGVDLHLLTQEQYSLILAGAVLSITVNPVLFRGVPRVEAFLQRFPGLWKRLNHQGKELAVAGETLQDHVVVIGYGRVGHHIADVLGRLNIPRLIVETDPALVKELEEKGVPTLFGDAANSEVLNHAGIEKARVLVVTLPDEAATEIVVAAGRALAPQIPIIARSTTRDGIKRLAELGAQDVIHPELEGGLEIVRDTLLRLGLPLQQVERYADAVRQDHYEETVSTPQETRVLEQLMRAARGMEIGWLTLDEASPLVGQTIAGANLRARTGASVIAVSRNGNLVANPKSAFRLQPGDLVGLIGNAEQIQAVEELTGYDWGEPIPE